MARSVRLSADDAWAVIEDAHTGVLTTLRRDGVPIALPIWFVVLDRRVFVSGPAATKKFSRLQHDDRVSFLVERGERWAELVGIHLTGRASFVDDPGLSERVSGAMAEKYSTFRTRREEMPDPTRSHYETSIATVMIEPDERILSWDNSRLFGEPES